MRRLLFVLAVALWLAPSAAEAACSGSGLVGSCTSGSTTSQINTLIGTLSDEAVITLANGTYTGTDANIAQGGQNGISIVCASEGGCTFTSSGNVFLTDTCGASITNLVRISGMVFSGSPSTGLIWLYCSDGYDITSVRIDHNTFTNFAGSQAIFFGETSSASEIFGVVDNNTFTSAQNGMAFKNVAGGETWATGRKGSALCAFFEDNSIDFVDNTNLGLSGYDGYGASCTVLRMNTVRGTRLEQHSLCHPGMMNFEAYANDIEDDEADSPNYRNLHSQGSGELTFWRNRVKGSHMAIQHYRSDLSQMPEPDGQGGCVGAAEICDGDFVSASGIPQTDGNRSGGFGYPCWHQPGRDGAGTLKPMYLFRNYNESNALVLADIESGSWTGNIANCANNDNNRIDCHIVTNRDLYQSVSLTAQTSASSPFDGTAGVGHGTIANRPETCTAGPGGADGTNGGVAYWATDQGDWNESTTNTYGVQMSGEDGILYRCSATDTWTQDYEPYTYPHPLRGESPGGGDPPAGGPYRFRFRVELFALPIFAFVAFAARRGRWVGAGVGHAK